MDDSTKQHSLLNLETEKHPRPILYFSPCFICPSYVSVTVGRQYFQYETKNSTKRCNANKEINSPINDAHCPNVMDQSEQVKKPKTHCSMT